MSCFTCGYSPCCCGNDCLPSPSTQQCACADPGLVATGVSLAVYDQKQCARRQTGSGFVTMVQNSTGGTAVVVTNDPTIPTTELSLGSGVLFTGLLAMTGSGPILRRLLPTAAGPLVANADGTWQISSFPAASIPDPLTVTTLNATNVSTSVLTVSGLPTFTGLATGTITQNIGLDASNHLVTGTIATTEKALYYENASLTSATLPNSSVSANAPVNIAGGEIWDSGNIAHIINSQTIQIDVAGQYQIDWFAAVNGFNPGTSSGTVYSPGLSLYIVGTGIVANGSSNSGMFQSYRGGGPLVGTWMGNLAANQQIQLWTNSGWNTTAGRSGLSQVTVTLTKFK